MRLRVSEMTGRLFKIVYVITIAYASISLIGYIIDFLNENFGYESEINSDIIYSILDIVLIATVFLKGKRRTVVILLDSLLISLLCFTQIYYTWSFAGHPKFVIDSEISPIFFDLSFYVISAIFFCINTIAAALELQRR
jgi:hypothetical protein